MKSIKELFSIKILNDSIAKPIENEEDREQIRITYYQSGFTASIKATGQPIVLKTCLQNLYSSFENQCKKQKEEQDRLKQPYKEEQERHRIELKKHEIGLLIHEKKEEQLSNSIENLKQEIVDVRRNPDKYIDGIKGLTAQFYIGLGLLIPITLYLLVFYVSASYSAFFKEFSDDSLTAAIFDKDAFNNSFRDSWLEGILVITIPFVFMGLGFIIHMVQKNTGFKNTIRLVSLFILTFLFDALLAYQIEKKIYEFNKTPNSPLYNLKIALGEGEFWMIIFAGFVVYVIWGLVFDFMMKEHEKLDMIKVYVKSKNEEIKNIEKQLVKIIQLINEFKNKVIDENGKISILHAKIDGFVFPIKEYLNYHNQYKEGWLQAIGTEIALAVNSKGNLLIECDNIANEHLESLGLINPDFQHLVYSKN